MKYVLEVSMTRIFKFQLHDVQEGYYFGKFNYSIHLKNFPEHHVVRINPSEEAENLKHCNKLTKMAGTKNHLTDWYSRFTYLTQK